MERPCSGKNPPEPRAHFSPTFFAVVCEVDVLLLELASPRVARLDNGIWAFVCYLLSGEENPPSSSLARFLLGVFVCLACNSYRLTNLLGLALLGPSYDALQTASACFAPFSALIRWPE